MCPHKFGGGFRGNPHFHAKNVQHDVAAERKVLVDQQVSSHMRRLNRGDLNIIVKTVEFLARATQGEKVEELENLVPIFVDLLRQTGLAEHVQHNKTTYAQIKQVALWRLNNIK